MAEPRRNDGHSSSCETSADTKGGRSFYHALSLPEKDKKTLRQNKVALLLCLVIKNTSVSVRKTGAIETQPISFPKWGGGEG